jgi:hypothetical protein
VQFPNHSLHISKAIMDTSGFDKGSLVYWVFARIFEMSLAKLCIRVMGL